MKLVVTTTIKTQDIGPTKTTSDVYKKRIITIVETQEWIEINEPGPKVKRVDGKLWEQLQYGIGDNGQF